MTSDLFKWLLQQFPNFAALIAMIIVLIVGFGQVLERYDQTTRLLYACLAGGSVR